MFTVWEAFSAKRNISYTHYNSSSIEWQNNLPVEDHTYNNSSYKCDPPLEDYFATQ